MALHILDETKRALGGDGLPKLTSRSLKLDRFAEPDSEADARKEWFKKLIAIKADPAVPYPPPLSLPQGDVLYARLMSRLMVDLAGGVMENASLRLDRYGLPTIPGSAIKGCARRMALQALHDWVAAGTPRPADDDTCAPCCEGFDSPAAMLSTIAHVFGWTPLDWTCHDTSDFAWAVHGNQATLDDAKTRIPNFETFAGTIAFLPASPNRDPGLELDVVTPHHTRYYKQEPGFEHALDTEDPIPVYFPAVAPQIAGEYFSFPLARLKHAADTSLAHAKRWLGSGLQLIGVGAKTNAGYGWFDTSPTLQEQVRDQINKLEAAQQAMRLEQKDLDTQAKASEAARFKRQQEAEATEGMSAAEIAEWKIDQLTPGQFEAKLKVFFKESNRGGLNDDEKSAIIKSLRGPRLEMWNILKSKATKGGEWARAEQAIRTYNKSINQDKMP